jgi:2-amino-4-hydroxy-6-hydroxymethyldihydropteridine diphosphokinase
LNLEFKTLNHQTFLSTGSNLGDRLENLRQARQHIEYEIGKIVKSSHIYITQAWGVRDQPDFLNQALEVETALSPEELLEKIHTIEHKMGRVRSAHWSKRLIDIDILFYEQLIMNTKSLTLPHPFLHERNFVLAPMSEIAPDFQHPILQKTMVTMYKDSQDALDVKILTE